MALQVLQFLRPFSRTGPFISMIIYVLHDVLPFLLMSALMVFTFGMAFFVLHANISDGEEGQNFDNAWNSIQSAFHAMLGAFEPDVRAAPLLQLP